MAWRSREGPYGILCMLIQRWKHNTCLWLENVIRRVDPAPVQNKLPVWSTESVMRAVS